MKQEKVYPQGQLKLTYIKFVIWNSCTSYIFKIYQKKRLSLGGRTEKLKIAVLGQVMWSLKKFCAGQFLVCEPGKVSTFNFWKVHTRHHRWNFFTGSNFSWYQQKFEIHIYQQQNILWSRITSLWNPLAKENSFKYFWL